MYQIVTYNRRQVYYWYGQNKWWKLSPELSHQYETWQDAMVDFEFIKKRQDWAAERVEIVKIKVD